MRTTKLVGMIKEIAKDRLVRENLRNRYARTNNLAEEDDDTDPGTTDTGQKASPVNKTPKLNSIDARR